MIKLMKYLKKSAGFIAAVKADTYVLPSPLFADCITILPIAVMEN